LPTFGNNDFKFHYEVPDDDYKLEFYSKIMKGWFTDQPTNSKTLNTDLIKTTFLYGGYYRVNFGSNITLLAMNSIAFSIKNNASLDYD
jgi:hypothetical protein